MFPVSSNFGAHVITTNIKRTRETESHSQPRPASFTIESESSKENPVNGAVPAASTRPVSGPPRIPHGRHLDPVITSNSNPAVSLVRLYLMSYFPSGFWPRLITRLLGDDTFYNLVLSLYELPDLLVDTEGYLLGEGVRPEWRCWQSGLELCYLGQVALRLKEVQPDSLQAFCDYRQCDLAIKTDQYPDWSPLNLHMLSILEMFIPNESITVQFEFSHTGRSRSYNEGFQGIVIQPNSQVVAALLARTVDHLDTLLEDWYPDLGARFVQNARGMYLITRLVPCPRCLLQQMEQQEEVQKSSEAWSMVEVSPCTNNAQISQPILISHSTTATSTIPTTATEGAPCLPEILDGILYSESAPVGDSVQALVDTAYREGRRVVRSVESAYSRTVEATGGALGRLSNGSVMCPTHNSYSRTRLESAY